MLRYRADLKTVLWMFMTSTLLVLLWRTSNFNGWLYALYLYFSVAASVIAHNHNHVRMWKSKTLNHLTDIWITLFYGFPVFGWIPTHNKNHHKFNNTDPDHTKTWRFWETNNLLTLLSYPTISGYYQQKAISSYVVEMYRKNRRLFWAAISQIAALITWTATAFVLDWQKALLYVVIPQQVSLNTVLVFNYIQHVHANEEDQWNHSRNITGPVLNFLLFNNGLHTIHHIKPGLHWSQTPAAHKEIENNIDPSLNEPSFVWYLIRVYVLGLFFPNLRTHSMRLNRLRDAEAVSA